MADRGILFTGQMVGALLDERKTQTRRIGQTEDGAERLLCRKCGCSEKFWKLGRHSPHCSGTLEWTASNLPRHHVGDRLYVREAWATLKSADSVNPAKLNKTTPIFYVTDGAFSHPGTHTWGRLRASMHMPRWATRLTLTVKEVRVQPLWAISEDDAIAEGAQQVNGLWTYDGGENAGTNAAEMYAMLFDQINGAGTWARNPWVIAYTFRVERKNIDA